MPDLPLTGLRIVEMSQIVAAPYAGQMLGDMGAEVIKIEVPDGGDVSRSYGPYRFGDPAGGPGHGLSYYFCAFNRNKQSVTLNLRHPAAADALRELIKRSDVFLHNSLAASIERLGFGYEQVRPLSPRLIYCAISGYGKAGPDKDTAGLDMAAQAASGLMYLTGEPDGRPMRAGVPIADLVAGMFAAYAILAALRQRDRTGEGQMVDTSLFEAAAALTSYQGSQYLAAQENPQRLGNAHPSIVPYDSYQCADGYVVIAGANQGIWERLCKALLMEALLEDERFKTAGDRSNNRAALGQIISLKLQDMPAAAVIAALRPAGVPAEVVRDLRQVFDDPQAQALRLVQPLSRDALQIPAIAPPYHLSALEDDFARRPPPALGEHTAKWLREIGLSGEAIAQLRSEGAI
jgi:crotonobetainyl-CoA:carnitine CoA-transferase CaiB-like acyl-CoA transferase